MVGSAVTRWRFAFAILISLPPAAAKSQELLPVKIGEQVRVSAPQVGDKREGRLLSLSPDSLRIEVQKRSVSVGVKDLASLEVRRRSAGAFGRSVGVGFLVGAGLGALLSSGAKDPNATELGGPVLGGILGGVAGVVGGLFYGACCASDWTSVPIPRAN